jgi:putative ABC transport system ATP-binding protein
VSVRYRSASEVVDAVHEVDADVARGELTVLAGPSGSGKSSLLRTLAGLQLPHAGTVVVDGVDLGRLRRGELRRLRRRSIGYVLEDPASNLLEYLRAREQVALAARLRRSGRGDERGGRASRGPRINASDIAELLGSLGLADHLDTYPPALSGGQQQRVAFAAAAVGGPTLLLADEPTAALDGRSGEMLIAAMRSLVAGGQTLVAATHDPAVIAAADTVIMLRNGRRDGA